MLGLLDYFDAVTRTANRELTREQQAINASLSLVEEVGEVISLWKKHVFHHHELDLVKLEKELGDCMFYTTWLWLIAFDGEQVNVKEIEDRILWTVAIQSENRFTFEGLADAARVAIKCLDNLSAGILERTTLFRMYDCIHELAWFIGKPLAEVAQTNVDKLKLRYPNGFTTQASVARVDTDDEIR